MTFNDILATTSGPVSYELTTHGHMKMIGHSFPYSIKNDEFVYLQQLIVEHKLMRGFECATAFGISSCAIASGFQRTGGKLVTLDAYIEEETKDPNVYRNVSSHTYNESAGYKSVMFLREHFNLTNNLYPEIGWSPNDVDTIIKKHFHGDLLDFVFLDAGHFSEQMIKDIDAFVPFLDSKFVLAFHDDYPWSFSPEVHQHLMKKIGKDCQIVVPHPRGENLSVVVNV